MDTDHVIDRLTDYLLGEVIVQERDAIRAHLVTCRDCAAEEAALRRSITRVEDALRSERLAPDDFPDRVMRRIGADTRPVSGMAVPAFGDEGPILPNSGKDTTSRESRILIEKRGPTAQVGTARRQWKWAVVLTISLLGTAALQHERAEHSRPAGQQTRHGTQLSASPRATTPAAVLQKPAAVLQKPAAAALTLPAMLAVYREVSRSSAVSEVAATEPAADAAALTARVGFLVAPVDLAAQGAPTRGTRVIRLLGRPVAVLVLTYRGRPLALYQMNSRGISLPAMPVMNAVGRRILCGHARDCHLVAWRSGGRLFVLAGNVPDRQLVMLASAVPDHGGVA